MEKEESKWRTIDTLGLTLAVLAILSGIGAFLSSPLETYTKLSAISIISLLATIIIILGEGDGNQNRNNTR